MSSAAVSAILEGMPEAADLRVLRSDGVTWVSAGKTLLFRFADDDAGMRNIAVAGLRQMGFGGTQVAAALGLTVNYVATLHQRAQREGTAGLVRPRGRPRELEPSRWEQARQWRADGVRDAEIARRLGVQQSTVLRRLGPAQVQGELEPEDAAAAAPGREEEHLPEAGPEAVPEPGVLPPGLGGTARHAGGTRVFTRYAGAMLLHAYPGRAGEILPDTAGGEAREAALLSAVSTGFALGAATAEQFKHLAPREAGPLAGLAGLPSLRTLRPRLAAIADTADPLALQRMFAQAMLAATPETSGVYYVDDHFVPYAGAKPVGKGWNNKRGKAEKGRADTHVTTHDGRAVCFVTGEPSGLSVTLPKALKELKKAIPPGTPAMLGFDRGGAYPGVFRHCREQGVHWVTYRRAPLAVPAMLPVIATVTVAGRRGQITWAEEAVQLKDYGEARQITLFEHGQVALQILTSDFDACPAGLLDWLKSRWREENFLKYASENYGIDKVCDYIASIETNTKITDNPARKHANATIREAEKNLAAAERDLAVLLADPAITPQAKNAKLIPAADKKIAAARKKLAAATAAREKIPAKLPANVIDPQAQVALLRTGRRGLQMVLRLLAHNAEHWLSNQLNAYLRDDDEYRAITRETIIRGTAGILAFTPDAITVTLAQPAEPRVARALALLIDQVNATPPRIPGDTRPITYQLTPNPVI
jgi:transposase